MEKIQNDIKLRHNDNTRVCNGDTNHKDLVANLYLDLAEQEKHNIKQMIKEADKEEIPGISNLVRPGTIINDCTMINKKPYLSQ